MTLTELTTHYAAVKRRLYGRMDRPKDVRTIVGINRDVAVRMICAKYDCTLDDLCGHQRLFTEARRELWSKCRHKVVIGNNRRPTFREIGIWFERDGDTVRDGIAKHDARVRL